MFEYVREATTRSGGIGRNRVIGDASAKAEATARAGRREGFAFSPHDRAAIDGEVTYGDASMTTEWLQTNFPHWQFAGIDRSFDDAYQIYVSLQLA